MNLRSLIVSIVLAASLGACGQNTAVDQVQLAATLDQLYADYTEADVKLDPLNATINGDNRFNAEMPNFLSAEYRQQIHDLNQSWLDKALPLDGSRLEGTGRISYELFVGNLRQSLESEKFPDWMLPVNQVSNSLIGLMVSLGSGSGAQPFITVKDYDNWLKRGGGIPAIYDQAIANMRLGIKAGVVQPRVLMEQIDPLFGFIIKDDPTQTPFWGPITQMPVEFSAADKTRLTTAYRELIANQLMPAYKRLRAFIADEYLPATRTTVGWGELPDGQAWYSFMTKTQTTTDLTPAQIHEIGLKEVERIHAEIRELMKQVSFSGDLQAFFKFMSTDKQFEFPSEQALLATYNALRPRVDAKIPEQFSLVPKGGFEIRAFGGPPQPPIAEPPPGAPPQTEPPPGAPPQTEPPAPIAAYQPPSDDGSRPGVFFVGTNNLPSRKTWLAENIYLHEAVPGHHFQINIQRELKNLPAFRRNGGTVAFLEGWATYAESLGKDLGVYSDPYQYFGRLEGEVWRSIRLVVDTGIHSKGWTREQSIAYMVANSAFDRDAAINAVESSLAIPGRALSYKIGELKIQALKKKVKAELGDQYDPRVFHAKVLEDGSMPWSLLEDKIDRWLAEVKKAPKLVPR